MGKIPYFPFYPDDYLSSPGVTTCDLLDEGIYVRLLAYSWKHPGCQLPDDLKYLQRLCKGVRTHVIQRVLDRHFERLELSHSVFVWRNARLHFEFTRALLRSEHGEKGAKGRWNKEKADAPAMPEQCPKDAYQNQNQNQNQNQTTPKNKVKSTVDTSAKKPRFVHPSLEQVQEYCQERKNNVDPQKWIDHYTSNGWMVGRNPMKDWKAAIRTWEINAHGSSGSAKPARSFATEELRAALANTNNRALPAVSDEAKALFFSLVKQAGLKWSEMQEAFNRGELKGI